MCVCGGGGGGGGRCDTALRGILVVKGSHFTFFSIFQEMFNLLCFDYKWK